MSRPISRIVGLDDSTMRGYLLNVLGTDQIHDFCGSRLSGVKQNIINAFKIVVSKNNKAKAKPMLDKIANKGLNNKRTYNTDNTTYNKKAKFKGGDLSEDMIIDNEYYTDSDLKSVNLPTDSEFIENQCQETIRIFLSTIMTDDIVGDKIKQVNPVQQNLKTFNGGNDKDFIPDNSSPGSVSDESVYDSKSKTKDSSVSNLSSDFNAEIVETSVDTPDEEPSVWVPDSFNKDNFTTFYNHIKTQVSLFIDYDINISEYLYYVCVDDIRTVYTLYIEVLDNAYNSYMQNPTEYAELQYFSNLYSTAKKYFVTNPSENILCGGGTKPLKKQSYKRNQFGGNDNEDKMSSKLSEFIKAMAFKFCNITNLSQDNYNSNKIAFNSWKKDNKNSGLRFANSNKWDYFEEMLLIYGRDNVEDYSSSWIRQQLYQDTQLNIEILKGLFIDGNVNCSLKTKADTLKHLIINAAEVPSRWKSQILNNYPSFIDSQKSGGKYDELDERMEKYNCGFDNSKNEKKQANMRYKIKMITAANKSSHSINIMCGINNSYEFTKTIKDFDVDSWTQVTLCEALSKAFDNITLILQDNKITTWESLISHVEYLNTQVKLKNAKKQTKSSNIIELFYEYSLFKGLGDISQEMTSVIKYGGGETYKPTKQNIVASFNSSGNAPRFFIANDRLSANRFILTLNYGLNYNNNNINVDAYGGYLNNFGCKQTSMYLVEKKSSVTVGGSKYSKSQKKRYFKSQQKTKKNKYSKTKKNKHSKPKK